MKRIIVTAAGSVLLLLAIGSVLFLETNLAVTICAAFWVVVAGSWLYTDWKRYQRLTDLTTQKNNADVKLKEQGILFDTLFDSTTVGTALVKLDGRLQRVNRALAELLGYTSEELMAMNFFYIIHPEDIASLQTNFQQLLNEQVTIFHAEQKCHKKNGDILWIISTVSLIQDINKTPQHFIIQVQDITLQKKAEERLRHMAYHDPLTGLANRNKLEQFVNHMLVSSRRHQQAFAIIFLDLDRFKNINDTMGHEAGDLLLQVIADRLRGAVRNTDMVARLGGDEFVLLITEVKKSESVAVIAQKILESILEAIVIKGQEIYITTSIGISLHPYDGQNMQTLMKNADLAMYRAKEHGRNNYQFYTLEMTSHAQEKMALQNALGHALVKNEFLLNYQPKMDLLTRQMTGVEALLRWKNKEYGVITPDEIVSLAEETGLIVPVSEWVLRTACKQLKFWQQLGFTSLSIAVNISSRLFKQGNFVEDIHTIIQETGITPHALEIEVTESTIMQDPENTIRVLYALKDLGVQIVIDDFGTGYWSLGNLRRLSVDRIKIDKTFIKNLMIDETSTLLTSAIIAMVKKLGIKAVAEGVETREQYEFLLHEGCAEIQGYYLTRPLSEEFMTKYLQHPIPDVEAAAQSEATT